MPVLTVEQIELFLLMFVRITTMLSLMPVFRHATIPVHYRLALSMFLAVLFFPGYEGIGMPAVGSLWQLAFYLVKEIFLALVIGFLFHTIFVAVSFAGSIIDLQMGFAMLQVQDPIMEGSMSSATGMFKLIIFTMLFLMFNGHYFLFIAIEKSFELIQPGQVFVEPGGILKAVLVTFTKTIEIAIRLAAPVLTIMVVTSVTLGVIAKTMPQMNIFFVGMPLKIAVGFASLVFVLPILFHIFQNQFQILYRDIWKVLKLMAA